MTTARHILALLRSHVAGDDEQFLSVALQVAAHEARQGHGKLAQEMRQLIDAAREKATAVERRGTGPVPLVQPKGELSNLLAARYSDTRLVSMVLTPAVKKRLERVVREQRQQERLRARDLVPRHKLLLIGPPGSGKTMTAAALAGELKLPLFTVLYDGLIGKFMGETAARLKLIFNAVALQRGVYFFDEFDAIGARRASSNDVGEIRRVLNSFLQLLENDDSHSLIIAATNHPDLLDKAVFRRFDDVIEYTPPDATIVRGLLEARLANFDLSSVSWNLVLGKAVGLSQAEIARAADEAAKGAVLSDAHTISTDLLVTAIEERRAATQ